MANDVRDGLLRGAHETSGIVGQDDNTSMGRDTHIDSGTYLNYYKDLGFATTEENANKLRSDNQTFDKQIGDATTAYNNAQSQLQAQYAAARAQIDAQSQVPDYNTAMSDAYNTYKNQPVGMNTDWEHADDPLGAFLFQDNYEHPIMDNPVSAAMYDEAVRNSNLSNFVNVSVVSNGQIEGTYSVPRGSVPNLMDSTLNGGWVDPDKQSHLLVDVRQGGKDYGQLLHDNLSNIQSQAYQGFIDQAAPAYNAAVNTRNQKINDASSILNSDYLSGEYTLSELKQKIDSTTAKRASDYDLLKTNYENKKANTASMLAGIKVTGK